MALLVENPNFEYFNDLPDISEAAEIFTSIHAEELLEQLGDIFLKHNTYNEYGLILLHRHFDMNEDEILVETFNQLRNLSIAIPWKAVGDYANPTDLNLMKQHSLTPEKYIVNQSYALTGPDGGIVAYEYLCHSTKFSTPAIEFTADLYAALKSFGLESIFGIRRLLNLQDGCCWEITPDGIRANITHYALNPPIEVLGTNMIQVIFAFNEKGQVRCVGECGYIQCPAGNCSHCTPHTLKDSDLNTRIS